MNVQSVRSEVAAVVVSFNTRELTRRALLSLQKSIYPIQKIIVVDNASSDGSVEMIRQEFSEIFLIENKENLGFAKANNQAIAHCFRQTFVWLVNSDAEVHPETLQTLVAELEKKPRVAMLGPTMVYPDGSLQSAGGYFPTFWNVCRYLFPITSFLPVGIRATLRDMALFPQQIPEAGIPLDYATGAACILRVSALKDIGLLGEEYFMYFEETDLAWRLKANGYEVRVISTPPVVHVYGGSYRRAHDPKRLEWFHRSLSLFVQKQYTGFHRTSILLLVQLFGRLSIWLKTTLRDS